MPGKYSHGVVLADYSTRGIISLNEEQRKEYAAFAPKPRSQSRAATGLGVKGVRAAQAGTYRPSTASSTQQSGSRRLVIKESSLSLSARSPARNHRPLISTNTFEPPLPVQPPPKTIPPPPHPAKQPTEESASSRPLPPSQRVIQSPELTSSDEVIPPPDSNRPPRKRFSRSYESLRRYARELQERTTIPTDGIHPTHRPDKSSRASPDGTEPPPYVKHVKPETPPPPIGPQPQAEPSRPLSATTLTARVHAPPVIRPYSEEPNFDDFVNALDDFDSDRGDATSSTSPSYENGTSQRTPTRDNFEHDAFLEMALPSKSRPRKISHERDVPSRATATTSTSTNSVAESQPARTNSSVSSSHSLNNPASAAASAAQPPTSSKPIASSDTTTNSLINSATKKAALSPRARSPVAHVDPPWLLPRIKEDDKDFTPSIFEDRESIYFDDHDRDSITVSTGKVGQISSSTTTTMTTTARNARPDSERKQSRGRNSSDTSAAFPPPITRFKDDEAEFNANMTKMFGEGVVGGSSGSSSKNGSNNERKNGVGTRKGIFSRFTRRS